MSHDSGLDVGGADPSRTNCIDFSHQEAYTRKFGFATGPTDTPPCNLGLFVRLMPSVRCRMDLSSLCSKSIAQRGTQPPRSKDPKSRVPSEPGAVATGCLTYRRDASGGFKTMAEQSLERNHLWGYGPLSTNTFRTMIMYCNLKNMVLLRVSFTRLYPVPGPFYSPHAEPPRLGDSLSSSW